MFQNLWKPKNMITILVAFAYGASAFADIDDVVREKVVWDNKKLAATISDYTVGATVVAPFGFALSGNDKERKTLITASAFGVSQLVNSIVKVTVRRKRPNGENDFSFYSGHTTTAFTGAGLVCLYQDIGSCLAMLGLATSVGYLRIAADKHYFSDVVVGAGLGYAHGRFIPMLIANW